MVLFSDTQNTEKEKPKNLNQVRLESDALTWVQRIKP